MLKEINKEKFIYRLKTIKNENGWSLKEMGEYANTNKSNVSKWINDKQLPRNPFELMPLAKAAGVSLDWLMGYEPVILHTDVKIPIFDVNINDINTSMDVFIENNTPSGYYQTSEYHASELYVKYTGGAMHNMILNNSIIGIKLSSVSKIDYGSIYCIKTKDNVTHIGYVNYLDEDNILVKFYNNSVNSVPIKKTYVNFVYQIVNEIRHFT